MESRFTLWFLIDTFYSNQKLSDNLFVPIIVTCILFTICVFVYFQHKTHYTRVCPLPLHIPRPSNDRPSHIHHQNMTENRWTLEHRRARSCHPRWANMSASRSGWRYPNHLSTRKNLPYIPEQQTVHLKCKCSLTGDWMHAQYVCNSIKVIWSLLRIVEAFNSCHHHF